MGKIFTKSAISNLKSAGTFFPSSKYLSNKISSLIPENADSVVELGAGNGVVSKSILNQLSENAKLSCYEINSDFIQLLKDNVQDPRMTIIEHSALEITNDFGENTLDAVVSCLPLALFEDEMKHELMTAIHKSLKPRGAFIQYQYSLKDHKFIKKYFGCRKLRFVLRNIPPAFIYTCRK